MNKLETLQKENKNLKDLLEEVYEMSCLDEMINELRSGEDDEILLCHLSLKSQIMEALGKRKLAEKLKFTNTEDSLKIKDVAKLTSHNGSSVTTDHYIQPKKSEEVKS